MSSPAREIAHSIDPSSTSHGQPSELSLPQLGPLFPHQPLVCDTIHKNNSSNSEQKNKNKTTSSSISSAHSGGGKKKPSHKSMCYVCVFLYTYTYTRIYT
jgi:hypothetical protein